MASVNAQRSRLPGGASAATANTEKPRASESTFAAAEDRPSESASAIVDQPLAWTLAARVERKSGYSANPAKPSVAQLASVAVAATARVMAAVPGRRVTRNQTSRGQRKS